MSDLVKEAKAKSARVDILEEVSREMGADWRLCLQWCRYVYDNGHSELGYRFIWRKPTTNHLQGARG